MNQIKLILVLPLIPLITSCQAIKSLGLKVVNHSPPQVEPPSMAAFEEAGCGIDEDGWWVCPDESPIPGLGCDRIKPTDALLGALEPAMPMAECLYYPTQHLEEDPAAFEAPRLYNKGCLLPVYVRYVIFSDGGVVTLTTRESLQRAFAPVTSPEEALSYAIAVSGLQAKFELKRQANLRYLTDRLEDSHAVQTPEGYKVLLFHYQICGCGPHTTSAVWLEVSRDGDIREISRTPVYEDPAEDNLCVD